MSKNLRHILATIAILIAVTHGYGQTIDDNDAYNFNNYYRHEVLKTKQSISKPFIREDDILWEDYVWRTIDLKEKFNQFFYFPTDPSGVNGRKCLARVIWDAIVANEIPIYEDDEFKIPIDCEDFVARYTKSDTIILEIEDEDENYEFQTVLVPKEFESEDIRQIRLKEVWYIDNVTSRQHVYILGLTLAKDIFKGNDADLEYIGTAELFWIPLSSSAVRNMLVRNEAYYEDNTAHLPSWNHILETRMFESFITRESNRFNRSISSYLSGTDALLESERIEYKLLEISEDMWEY